MVIKRVLTNNAVIVEVDNLEKICLGKGIGFAKNKGDVVDSNNVDKIFSLENDFNQYENVLNIPYEYIDLSSKLVSYAKDTLNKIFNESLILTLADHIHGSVLRIQNPNIRKLDNPFLNDLIIFYEKEFNVAKKTNELIKDFLDIEFTDNEIGFIALHIINSQKDFLNNNEIVNKIVDQVLKIIEFMFKLQLDKNSFDYNRFITHLKYFALRIMKKEELKISNQKDQDDLFEFIKNSYQQSYLTSLKIVDFLNNEYNFKIDNNEITYLTIHIKRLLDTHK